MRKFLWKMFFIATSFAFMSCSLSGTMPKIENEGNHLTQNLTDCRYKIMEARNGVEAVRLIKDSVGQNSKNTLVFTDCDDVIFTMLDRNLYLLNINGFFEKFNLSAEQRRKIIHQAPKVVVDPLLLMTLSDLEKKGIPCINLTACSTDPESLEWRILDLLKTALQLANLPIDGFVCHLILKEQVRTNKSLKLKFGQIKPTPPTYVVWDSPTGMGYTLFTGSAQKGDVLKNFLHDYRSYIQELPDTCQVNELKIILIDDFFDNLRGAEDACKELGIKEFFGIHLTDVENRLVPSLGKEATFIQAAFFAIYGRWVSDSLATAYVTPFNAVPPQFWNTLGS